jgi:hypothetical protein
MKLYYTNPTAEEYPQSDPRLSLGGYKSASPVPNDSFDNLFGEISQFMLSKNIPEDEYIGLILKNETAYNIQGITLWFDYGNNAFSTFKVAAVNLTPDANGVLKMEHIPSRTSQPLYADFYEANGVGNAVEIGDLEVGEMVGLWIVRSLIDGLAASVQSDDKLYQPNPVLTDQVIPIVLDKYDSVSISFDWLTYGTAIGEELITDYFVTQDLATLYSGDTYLGCEFSLSNEDNPDLPLDLSNAKIDLVTNNSNYGLSTTDGTLEITDGLGGAFKIPEQIISWPAATYNFKIKITFPGGRVRTYVVGTWKILK